MDTWLAKLPKTNKLTKHDKEIIEKAPKGTWFAPNELPTLFKNRDAICERLRCKGVFERRSNDSMYWKYKVKERENETN